MERVLALDDGACMAEIQALLGHGAGRLRRIGRHQPWPLALTRADALTASRAVLVGNAAQTLHPIGAQGFNLGLRDAMVLARRCCAALRDGTDPGAPALLAAHAAARAGDRAPSSGPTAWSAASPIAARRCGSRAGSRWRRWNAGPTPSANWPGG